MPQVSHIKPSGNVTPHGRRNQAVELLSHYNCPLPPFYRPRQKLCVCVWHGKHSSWSLKPVHISMGMSRRGLAEEHTSMRATGPILLEHTGNSLCNLLQALFEWGYLIAKLFSGQDLLQTRPVESRLRKDGLSKFDWGQIPNPWIKPFFSVL